MKQNMKLSLHRQCLCRQRSFLAPSYAVWSSSVRRKTLSVSATLSQATKKCLNFLCTVLMPVCAVLFGMLHHAEAHVSLKTETMGELVCLLQYTRCPHFIMICPVCCMWHMMTDDLINLDICWLVLVFKFSASLGFTRCNTLYNHNKLTTKAHDHQLVQKVANYYGRYALDCIQTPLHSIIKLITARVVLCKWWRTETQYSIFKGHFDTF